MICSSCKTDENKVELVLLEGKLQRGSEIWVCPSCDIPDKPVDSAKSIIDISKENHGRDRDSS